MNCIIIDDEPHCRGALEILLRTEFPDLIISASCKDGFDGIKAIQKYHPALIFLDISMPGLNGFEMLDRIDVVTFDIIFTTAFDQYALRAFRANALDYLLKPINKTEFITAVHKVMRSRLKQKQSHEDLHSTYSNIHQSLQNVAIPTLSGLTMVRKSDINYIESSGNYCKIHMLDQSGVLVSKTLKEIKAYLDSIQFVRIHRSFVINVDHLHKYYKGEGGYVVMKNGTKLDVSRRKKEDLLKVLIKKR